MILRFVRQKDRSRFTVGNVRNFFIYPNGYSIQHSDGSIRFIDFSLAYLDGAYVGSEIPPCHSL